MNSLNVEWLSTMHRRCALIWGLCLALLCSGGLFSARAAAQEVNEAATRQFAAAAALQNREQFELAVDEWKKFIATHGQHPEAPRARHYLGLCYLKTGKLTEAIDTLAKLIPEQPKLTEIDTSQFLLGLARYQLAQQKNDPKLHEQAATTFAELVQKHPKGQHVAEGLYYQGEATYASGQREAAVKLYQTVADRFAKDPLAANALYAWGVTLEELGRFAEADSVYDRFLKGFAQHPLSVEVNMRRAETLLQQGKAAEAEPRFAQAAAAPGFALADHALMRQGAALFEQQKFAAAATLYATLPQKFPQSKSIPDAWLAAGRSAYAAGKYPDARQALGQVAADGSERAWEAVHWLARAWLKEQQPAEALKLLDARVKGKVDGRWGASLAMDRADALFDTPSRQKEAATAYAALVTGFPKDPLAPQALYLAAFASLTTGDLDAALKHAQQFLQQYSDHELSAEVGYVAAEGHLQKKSYDEAAKLYGQLALRFPQHRDASLWRVRQGLSYVLAKKFAEAQTALSAVAGKLSTPELNAEAAYLLGTSALEQNNAAAAATALTASLQASPKWRQADETRLALAQAWRQLDKPADARRELETLLKEFPQSAVVDRAHYRLGEVLFAQEQFADAAREYGQVVTGTPQSSLVPFALYGLGWSQYRRGDYTAAAAPLNDLLTRFGQHELVGQARYLRALVQQELKNPAAAIADLDAFLKTNPSGVDRSNARYALGLAQTAAQQLEPAIATFRTLLKEDPQYAGTDKALYELAWTLRLAKQEAESVATFARLAKEHGKSPLAAEAWYHVGDDFYTKEQWQPATEAYFNASQQSADKGLGEKAAHKLGWAYYQAGDYDKARQTFEFQRGSFANGELLADARFMEGECFFKQQKYPQALAAYALVKPPARSEMLILARWHGAQAANALKDWSQGLSLAREAQQIGPQSPQLAEILFEQAWALHNQGQVDAALKLYEEVTDRSEAEVAARARFMIGEIYFERKDHKEAVRNFFKVAYVYGYPTWQAAAQYEAGRCFEVLGQVDQARKSYQEIVTKYPDHERAAQARERLGALKP